MKAMLMFASSDGCPVAMTENVS